MYDTILFVSPKQGGILQSSGFLDLTSLMALSRTCKANAFDELSLIQWIENEMTHYHSVRTMEEAITFCRNAYRSSFLRQWLERDSTEAATALLLSEDSNFEATTYEIMISKMLLTLPESQRLKLVCRQDTCDRRGETVLHRVANCPQSLQLILSLLPESQRLQALSRENHYGHVVLHSAAYSGNVDSIRLVLSKYPESQRLAAVTSQDINGRTALLIVANSGNSQSITTLLNLVPESQLLHAVNTENEHGFTALHYAGRSDSVGAIETILSLYPESQRLQALYDLESIKYTLDLFTDSETSSDLKRLYSTLQEIREKKEVERSKRQRTGEPT